MISLSTPANFLAMPLKHLPEEITFGQQQFPSTSNHLITAGEETTTTLASHWYLPFPNPTSWNELVQSLPQWEQLLFFGLQIVDEQRLIDRLILGEIIYTNDGSAPDKASLAGQWWHPTEHDWPHALALHGASNQVLTKQRATECCPPCDF